MAHFYGKVSGGRSPGSRCGHKTTGLTSLSKGWGGSVAVRLWYNKNTKEDWAEVTIQPENGQIFWLYKGPLDRYVDPRGNLLPIAE